VFLSFQVRKIIFSTFQQRLCTGNYEGVLISLWLFLFPIFPFAAQPKEFFLYGLKKLEKRSHKCVELRGEYLSKYIFSIPYLVVFFKAKDLSAPLVFHIILALNTYPTNCKNCEVQSENTSRTGVGSEVNSL
jgi:hypothetical protein